MNAPYDDQSDEPKEPGLTQHADDETASPGLTRNKAEAMTPGEILRDGRLAHDYSVEDLCAQTKLSAHTIEALEEDDFQSLSQPVFARGYYRQCAKVLDLDVERLMAAYTAIAGETPQPRIDQRTIGAGVIPQDVTPGGGFRFRGLFILLLIVVAVVAAIVFVLPTNGVPGAITGNSGGDNTQQSDQNTKTFEFNSSNDDDTDSAGGDAAATTSAQNSDSDEAGSGTPDVVGDSGAQPRTGKQAGGRNVNQSLGIDPSNAAGGQASSEGDDASSANTSSVPANRLVLTFNKRSWIRVTDANGNRMASGIVESGATKEFNGEPPYKVTLGFAPGVKVSIGGKSVDVASQTSGGGIAHLTVAAADNGNG